MKQEAMKEVSVGWMMCVESNNTIEERCERCWKENPWIHTCTPMTEHEKLKEICDKIGYEIKWNHFDLWKDWYMWVDYWSGLGITSLREIIFTQEFKEYYFDSDSEFMETDHIAPILFNLNNPVSFLYDLIK